MSRRSRWFLHFAILALLLLAAWMFVDFAALGRALRRAPLPTVAVLVVAYCLDRLAMALKWQPLLRAVGIHIPLREVVLIYFEASFVGRALPTALGGDALRIYRVSKISGQTAAVVSAAAVEKIAGIIAAALIASFGAIWLARDLAEAELHPLLIAVPGCAALTVVLITRWRRVFSRRWSASYWIGLFFEHEMQHVWKSLTSSRGSTIQNGAIHQLVICHRLNSRRDITSKITKSGGY